MKRLAAREVLLLGVILAGALSLRLLGVGRGLPYLHEWDEPSILSNVVRMLQRGDLNPRDFGYPSVYFYLLLPVVYLHYAFLHAQGLLPSPLDIQLTHPQESFWYMHPVSFYLWGRTLTSLIGTATVYLAYRVGRTVYGTAAGLLAAAFLALAPGAVYFSDTVRVDIAMTFFVTLTTLCGLGVVLRGRWQDYLLAGLFAGIAISTKYSAFTVVLALLVAHVVNPRRGQLVDLRLVGMGLCVLIGVSIGTPYIVISPKLVIGWAFSTARLYGGAPIFASLQRHLPEYLAYLVSPNQAGDWTFVPHPAMGLLPIAAALIGMVAGFRWGRRPHLYLLSFPLLFFLYMSGQRMYPIQTMMPILPFAAVFAGVGCLAVWRWVVTRWPAAQTNPLARDLAGLALAAVLAVPGRDAVALGWTLGHRPDTRVAAVEWLQRHVAPGARIAFAEDLRWHTPDLYQLPFALRFAPRDANADWYTRQQVDFAVVGSGSPLRSLPAVAVFPRPSYLGPEYPYPVISPGLYIVRPKTVDLNMVSRIEVAAGGMILEPVATTASGESATLMRLPNQQFTPGAYTLSVAGVSAPQAAPADRHTVKIVVGRKTVGMVTVTGTQPLRYATPPFQFERTQTLPIRIELASQVQRSRPAQTWALRPSATGCAVAPDVPSLNLQQLTVEAWVYLEGMNEPPNLRARGGESEAPILGKGRHLGYYLRLVGDARSRIFADLSVAGKFAVGLAPSVPFRKWTHIAATYDSHEARIYLNGVPAPPSRDPRHEGIVHAEGAPLIIGCHDPGTPYQAAFKGFITGVRIWSRVLPPDAIRAEAGLLPPLGTHEGLVGSWSFESAIRGVIPDLSGTGNDLTADTAQRVPVADRLPPAPAWAPELTLLRTVTIRRVTFPIAIPAGDMAPDPAVSTGSGASAQTVHLPDQPFTPGLYTLAFAGGWRWPWPGGSPNDKITATVIVGRNTMGTTTISGTRPLRFTTHSFRIDRTETLPVQVRIAASIAHQALRPAADGCAAAQDAPALDLQRMTVEAWVYVERMNEPPGMRARGLESEAPILAKRTPEGYYLRLVGDAGGRIYADLSVAGKYSVGRGGVVPLRTWTHVAATYDGHEAVIYVNGVPAPPTRDPHHERVVRAEGAPLVIGCRDLEAPGDTRFKGFITGVRIWDRVLPPDIVRQEAGRGALPDTSEGLAGSWSFQALVRGTVPDQSGAGHPLAAGSLQTVPGEIGPPIPPEWIGGQSPLRTVTIDRVTFPRSVRSDGMFLDPPAASAGGASSVTIHLPDQPFTPGAYTLTVSGIWPQPGASASDRLTAKVVVGERTVGTATVDGTKPLRFTTPPFRIDRTQALPVHIDLENWTAEQVLYPPTSGCATSREAPALDTQQLTVEALVYPEELNEPFDMRSRGSESEAPILGKGKHLGYYLRLVGDAKGRVFADLSVAGKFSAGRAGPVPLHAWTHIAATYDGRETRIYLNGSPAPPERDPHHQGAVRSEHAPLVIGCRDPGTPDQLVFAGLIHRVRIWNTVLPPDAIRTEASLHPLPDASPGLVGSWSFLSLAGGRVPDLSGAGNALSADSLATVPREIGLPGRSASPARQPILLRNVTITRTAP